MSDLRAKPKVSPLGLSLRLVIISSTFAVGAYAYLGFFSRHLADDYCIVGLTRSNFFTALWENYLTVSDRFSNYMLIALSEFISPRSTAILPALMLALWTLGIAWLLWEASCFSGKAWDKQLVAALSLLTVFFAVLEAPNRYQTLYWRSALATHLAPLVLMPFFAGFLIRSIRSSRSIAPRAWPYLVSFLLTFLLGGFSEPTVALMIVLLAAGFFASWFWIDISLRKTSVSFLGWSLAGSLLALLVMGIAPANAFRLGTPPPALPLLVTRSFLYSYQFAWNSLRTLPLPALLSCLMPLIIFFGLHKSASESMTAAAQNSARNLLAIVPLFSYLLIVASFAPSVYGQAYPVERARFAGQVCLVIGLMIEGAVLGTLLAQWNQRTLSSLPLPAIAAVALAITALYPLRAAFETLKDAPAYRQRAILWDAREAYVLRHAALGQSDLIVPSFSGLYGIKEWDESPTHWVNRCVEAYYNVNTIRAAYVPDDFIMKVLGE